MRKLLFLVLLFGGLTAAFGQQAPRQTCTLGPAGTCNMGNPNGAYGASFEEIPNGTPSGVSVTVAGCMQGATCDAAADTNTSTSATVRGVTFTKAYDYFKITVGTLTGGTSPTMTINSVVTTANSHSAGVSGTAPIVVTGSVISCPTCGTSTGTVTSVAETVPSWLTVGGSPVTTSGTLAITATTGQTTHQVIGTCGAGTTFAPCALVPGDLPTAIPIANVGSAGLSATGPVRVASTGVIDILGSGTVAPAQGGTGVGNTATLTLGSSNMNLATLGTGIVKNTTTTGALSVAVGSDLPSAIPIASVGSAGLSGTLPVSIASTGAISVVLSGNNAQTTTYQVLASDFSSYKNITVTSGTFTITLVASGSQPPAGQYIRVINYGSGQVTIAASGQNINGSSTSLSLTAANNAQQTTSTYIQSDGTNYFAEVNNVNSAQLGGKTFAIPNPIGSSTPNTGAFTSLAAGSAKWNINTSGLPTLSNNKTLAGQGFPLLLGVTSQKSETTTADANVLTVTPAAAVGTYEACVSISVSAATSGVISWTLSWTDSNGNAQANIAMPLFQLGTAAPNTTFTTSAAGNYMGCADIDVNTAAAGIIVKWVGGGTTTAKVSATIKELN